MREKKGLVSDRPHTTIYVLSSYLFTCVLIPLYLYQTIGACTLIYSLVHGLAHIINLLLWDGWSFNGSLWCGHKDDGFLLCSAVSGMKYADTY
jgi:hypothetical protein